MTDSFYSDPKYCGSMLQMVLHLQTSMVVIVADQGVRVVEISLFFLENATYYAVESYTMARMPRIVCPGLPHHVIQLGNNRSAIFFDDSDYHSYLDWLGEAMQNNGCRLHAYVLMTNHVHLLLTPELPCSIAQTLQSLGRRYVRYINGVYRRTGTLWEGRFKSSVVQNDQYLLACYRYIELNPVRARMVNQPWGYRWSSYAHNGLGEKDKYIDDHREYLRLGSTCEERCEAYRRLFGMHLDAAMLGEIRDSANRNVILGSERFRDEIEANLSRRVRLFSYGGDRRSKHFRGES